MACKAENICHLALLGKRFADLWSRKHTSDIRWADWECALVLLIGNSAPWTPPWRRRICREIYGPFCPHELTVGLFLNCGPLSVTPSFPVEYSWKSLYFFFLPLHAASAPSSPLHIASGLCGLTLAAFTTLDLLKVALLPLSCLPISVFSNLKNLSKGMRSLSNWN